MKKLFITSVFMILVFSLLFSNVYALTATVDFSGAKEVEPGSNNKVVVSISSSSKIGGIEGKIVTSSNITKLTEQNVIGKNGWTVTYNEGTGVFNAFKAAGTTSEEFLEIEYTVGSQEGSAKIELKELNITDITYEEEEIGDVSNPITIVKKSEEDKNTNTDPENPIIDNTTPSQQSETKNVPTKTENTKSSTTTLPKTGGYSVIIPILIIGIIVILGSYFGYKKYKGIK